MSGEELKPCGKCRSFYDTGMGAVIHENNCPALVPQPSGTYEARYVHGGAPTDCVDYGVISHATGKEVCRVWERDDADLIARLLNAQEGVDRYRQALIAIQKAVLDGHVCDDVAWFDKFTTLHDFIEETLVPSPPAAVADLFPDAHPLPEQPQEGEHIADAGKMVATHPNTDQGVTAEVTHGWQSCRIGSCLRHEACMYRPCRAPKDVDALEAEISSLKQRLESAEGLLTQWRTWACGQEGASPFQDTRTFLQEQEKQNG